MKQFFQKKLQKITFAFFVFVTLFFNFSPFSLNNTNTNLFSASFETLNLLRGLDLLGWRSNDREWLTRRHHDTLVVGAVAAHGAQARRVRQALPLGAVLALRLCDARRLPLQPRLAGGLQSVEVR